MSHWKKPPETPDVDWDYDREDYVSVRVVVEWSWEFSPAKSEGFSFARYYWYSFKPGAWVIEGAMGNTIIHRFIDINEIR